MHRMHQMNSRPCQSQESPGRSLPMHGVTHGSLTNAQRRSDNCYECTHPCTALSAARSHMQWQIAISLVHQSLLFLLRYDSGVCSRYHLWMRTPNPARRSYDSVDSYTCCDSTFLLVFSLGF